MGKFNYYGCTEEQYYNCSDLIDEANDKTAKASTFFASACFLVLTAVSFIFKLIAIFRATYIMLFAICMVLCFLALRKVISSRIILYLLQIILYSLALAYSLKFLDARTVMAPVLIIIVPTLILDKYFRMMIFNTAFCVLYCVFMVIFKSDKVMMAEIFIIICCYFISGFIHYHIQSMIMRGFVSIHKLRLRSQQDSLTGLNNRKTFEKVVNNLLAAPKPGHLQVLGILDIDDFKKINDNYGHQAGDDFLIEISKHLKEIIAPSGCIGRIGGDEFMFSFSTDNPPEVDNIADSILKAIHSISTGDNNYFSASAGLACYVGSLTFAEMYRRADSALYEAKGKGKNTVCRYE